MRQWIIQKGAFLQTTLLLVKVIKGGKKNQAIKNESCYHVFT